MKRIKSFFNKININNHDIEKLSTKIRICFLFHSKAFWPSWASLWDACSKDPTIENTMIFCPVKTQNPGYTSQFIDAEIFLQQKGIPYINIDYFDFINNKPDFIIIQTPYDEYHRDKKWYSEEFSRLGIKVIYISYGLEFVETQLAIENHFRLPIYKCAKRIFTFAEFMKEDYSKFGNIDTNVVKSIGHPKFDALFTATKKKSSRKAHTENSWKKMYSLASSFSM